MRMRIRSIGVVLAVVLLMPGLRAADEKVSAKNNGPAKVSEWKLLRG